MRFMIGSLFGTKRELLDSLLERGMVMLHLDARRESVSVPVHHQDDHHLRLNLSLNFGIEDLTIDDEGVRAGLSFQGARFPCVMPWSAIFAITSHVEPVGYLWPDELPPELASQLGSVPATVSSAQPRLRIVRAREQQEPNREVTLEPVLAEVDETGKRYGHLRVIK